MGELFADERRSVQDGSVSRRLVARWAVRVVVCGAMSWASACTVPSVPVVDAGRDRDATLQDSMIVPADAYALDAAAADASASDASSAPSCGGSCDPRQLSMCTGACSLVDGAPACVVEVGDLGVGASCTAQTDCAPGLACFVDSAATGVGVCAELCCPGDDQCGADRRCGGAPDLIEGETTAWARCLDVRACDLVHPEYVCADREGCYIVDAEGHTECLVAGTAREGEACSRSGDCAPGGVCTGIREKTCARVCVLDTPRDCGTDRRCEAQAYSPVGTGICTTPVP